MPIEKLAPTTEMLEKRIQEQFAKARMTVGEQLAAQVLRAYEQGKVPAHELYTLVNTIRQVGNTNNPICDQLMQAYHALGRHSQGLPGTASVDF
jgi:hypothetical protein